LYCYFVISLFTDKIIYAVQLLHSNILGRKYLVIVERYSSKEVKFCVKVNLGRFESYCCKQVIGFQRVIVLISGTYYLRF
jgi:hypothetical protein